MTDSKTNVPTERKERKYTLQITINSKILCPSFVSKSLAGHSLSNVEGGWVSERAGSTMSEGRFTMSRGTYPHASSQQSTSRRFSHTLTQIFFMPLLVCTFLHWLRWRGNKQNKWLQAAEFHSKCDPVSLILLKIQLCKSTLQYLRLLLSKACIMAREYNISMGFAPFKQIFINSAVRDVKTINCQDRQKVSCSVTWIELFMHVWFPWQSWGISWCTSNKVKLLSSSFTILFYFIHKL